MLYLRYAPDDAGVELEAALALAGLKWQIVEADPGCLY
jgi:hypothetical protein